MTCATKEGGADDDASVIYLGSDESFHAFYASPVSARFACCFDNFSPVRVVLYLFLSRHCKTCGRCSVLHLRGAL